MQNKQKLSLSNFVTEGTYAGCVQQLTNLIFKVPNSVNIYATSNAEQTDGSIDYVGQKINPFGPY